MSVLDLATLALHRRQEMEDRLNMLVAKCDRAVANIIELKEQALGFPDQLNNCESSELKDKFLSCMKQLDEYNYLITEITLSLDNLDCTNFMPVHDVPDHFKLQTPLSPIPAMNLMDALSEPVPSTSKAINSCPPKKPKKKRTLKKDNLIAFSSSSSSASVPISKSSSEVQSILMNDVKKLTLGDSQPSTSSLEESDLPAQTILEGDYLYRATITHVDGQVFYIMTEDFEGAHNQLMEMNEYYKDKNNAVELSLDDLMSLTYCSVFDPDSDCYYRGLFMRLTQEDMSVAEVYFVDVGESWCTPTENIQPLAPRFRVKAPFARCCHLAGIELPAHLSKEQESLIKEYISRPCKVRVDDNTSESLGVVLVLPSGQTLNDLLVEQGLARKMDRSSNASVAESAPPDRGLPELDEASLDITNCPEYEDPLLAVTGYHNRDEMDICKHYKGGPEKTCFKGKRCTKRHVLKHPDGWTLDRVMVVAKCISVPLPAPGTHHSVYVTHVKHFNRFFVHLVDKSPKQEPLPEYGVILPPNTLNKLVLDMNSPATRAAYKPLTLIPATGELVAALYPPDEQWYRARVITSTRIDQNVEVMYIDYGNTVWLKEDALRELEPRFWPLPAQAVECKLAGVVAKTNDPSQWVTARAALHKMIHERVLQAHIIAREYDEVTVELFCDNGASVADQLAAAQHVALEYYELEDDTHLTQRMVLP